MVLAKNPLLAHWGNPLNTPKVLTVCVAGAEADVVAHLNALLEEQRGRLDARWRTADRANADLLVIDTDSLYGHMDWLKACASGRLVASWSSVPKTGDAQFRLHKPIVAKDLVALLNRVGTQLGGHSSPSGKPEQPPAPVRPISESNAPARPMPESAEPLRVVPERAVLESVAPSVELAPAAARVAAPPRGMQLTDLLKIDSPLKGRLRLAADGLPALLLDPHHRAWHTASTLKTLSDWCTRTLSSADVQSIDDAQFTAAVAKMPAQPYARLKWLAHLVRGEGRLDPGLDVNARYKLTRWPQSEREFPKHFRIATMMLKQASTLDEIAAQGGATIADVANFINAYHAIGYIEHDQPEPAQEEPHRGGLFGRARKILTN
jgi:hypothetical protein